MPVISVFVFHSKMPCSCENVDPYHISSGLILFKACIYIKHEIQCKNKIGLQIFRQANHAYIN